MTVTIRDVAQRLNLSITTVSRALDGYSDVAEATRQEVIRVAQEMGYIPNRAARQLRRQKADAIGYILPASQPRFSEPFYEEFVGGMADAAARHNVDLLVSTAPPDTEAEQQIYQRWVHGRRVDGMILNRMRFQDWRASHLCELGFPFVGLERPLNVPDLAPCAFIELDNRTGFQKLVQHLVEHGFQRLAYIGGQSQLRLQAERLQGYRDGLEAAGLPFDPQFITQADMTRRGGYAAARELLSVHKPDAILCVNDWTAIGALHAARDLGLQVGRDLAVTGFDGIDETEHTQPPLTTAKQPLYQIAGMLVEMLINLISATSPIPAAAVRLQAELILRESSGVQSNP